MWLLWPNQSPYSSPPAYLGPEPHSEGWVAAVGIAQPTGETRLPGMGQPPTEQPEVRFVEKGRSIRSFPPHPSTQEYLCCSPGQGRHRQDRGLARPSWCQMTANSEQAHEHDFSDGKVMGRKGCVRL